MVKFFKTFSLTFQMWKKFNIQYSTIVIANFMLVVNIVNSIKLSWLSWLKLIIFNNG
jgi:hypothetical protein